MKRHRRSLLWLAVPALATVGLILFVPWLFTLGMSLFEWKLRGSPGFVGVRNYASMLGDATGRWGWGPRWCSCVRSRSGRCCGSPSRSPC